MSGEDSETTSDADVTCEGLIESYAARVGAVVLPILLIALSIASMLLLGIDMVGIALGVVFIVWIAVAWWRLSRRPQS